MPPVNPVFVSAGVIAISVAVVAAIAVYENPELRRLADDFRRRIAVAAQSFHDDIFNDGDREQRQDDETEREPVFNRPEDAEGFMMSTGRRSAGDPGVVADEASRRRQREELMYWNSVRVARDRKIAEMNQTSAADHRPEHQQQHNTSFDHFMRQDDTADNGTYVINTGTDVARQSGSGSAASAYNDPLNGGLVRRRRPEGVHDNVRAAAVYSNPFGDEYGIELDDHDDHAAVSQPAPASISVSTRSNSDRPTTVAEAFDAHSAYLVAPDRDETMSDIYSATEPDTNNTTANVMDAVFDALPPIPEVVQVQAQAPARSEAASSSGVFFDVDDYATANTNISTNISTNTPATLADNDSQPSLRLTRQRNAEGVDSDTTLFDDGSRADMHHHNHHHQTQAYSTIQAWAEAQAEAQTNAASGSRAPSQASTSGSTGLIDNNNYNNNNNNNSGMSFGFYSPLPVTPSVAMSEPSVITNSSSSNSEAGELTPTGGSVFGDADGSGKDKNDENDDDDDDQSIIDHADAVRTPSHASSVERSSTTADSAVLLEQAPAAPTSPPRSVAASDFGVLSESEDDGLSVMTPTSWSEVGSVVSESDEYPMRV
ncbi:MAG: hypothetical protein STHCBS139747_005157 [Sporothrix thermara]